ncbi:hypothetical protein [Phyllobacterium sp. K27]
MSKTTNEFSPRRGSRMFSQSIASWMAARAGFLKSDFGTYVPALQIAGLMCLLTALSALLLGRSGLAGAPQAN